jgi:hypothetical protein
LRPNELHHDVVDALRDLELPLRGVGLPLLVDGQCDERRAVLLREDRLGVERLTAVFQVDGVDDGLATTELQPGLDDRHLGAVEHDGLAENLVVAPDALLHVANAVAADVVHAHIQNVNALAFLFAGHLGQPVPVFLFEELLELPRAVRVRPLADEQRALIDDQFLDGLEARHRGEVHWGAFRGLLPTHAVHDRLQVFLRGAATATDDVDAEFCHEPVHPLRERFRREWSPAGPRSAAR